MAWQFDRPEVGAGLVQVFRRENSPYEVARFELRGLKPTARYRVKRFYADAELELSGSELAEPGLLIALPDRPGVEIVTYAEILP